jgi:NADH dehydrogenase
MGKGSEARVVIVGAGFAGLRAAHRLARAGAQVTLIDRNNFHLFQPLLYQVATSGLNPSEIASTVRGNFSGLKNVRVVKAELSGLDRQGRRALCNEGALEFPYDYLILCVGGKTSYFGNDHWADLAPGLKTLDDATAIRNRFLENFEKAELENDPEEIRRLTSVVIIGGGPTGVELAGSFAELRGQVLNQDFRGFDPASSSVTLLEGGPTLLAGYDAKLADYTKKRLEKVGVEVRLNERVTDINEDGVVAGDHVFSSANVIWAAGVEGLPLAKALVDEVTPRNGVVVGPDLTVPGDERIYACGDMAYFAHDERYPRGLPGVAQVAMQQGDLAARNILAHLAGKPRKTFRYFDKGKMATIGRSAAVAEAKGLKMKGFVAWCAWLFIHVIYLVEFQDRVVVFFRWIWAYLTWHWGVRIIFQAKPLVESAPRPPLTEDRPDEGTADGIASESPSDAPPDGQSGSAASSG